MANYTNEIRVMMEKVSTMIVMQDKQGFYRSSLGADYSLLDVLILLYVSDQTCSIKDIVDHFGINRNIINSTVGSMVKKNILFKTRNDDDGRLQLIDLTPKGREIVENIQIEKNKELEFMLSEASINEEKAILKFLSKYIQYRTEKFVLKNPKESEH